MTRLHIEINGTFQTIRATKIGEGMFSKIYAPVDFTYQGINNPVIVMSKTSDEYSKEIMTNVSGEEFFPVIELLGYDRSYNRVYVMERYNKLRKDNAKPESWASFLMLNKAWKNHITIETIIDNITNEKIKEAIETLYSWAGSYGEEYGFEFNKANMALDNNGNLIILDPVFSKRKLREFWRNRG